MIALSERALRFLSSEVRGLHAAVYVLASATLLSSLLALFRDRLLAHTFGAGTELDIYYAAFRIPDLIFVGTGALVSVYILIPELARRDPAQQREYIDTIVLGFAMLAFCASSIAALLAPYFLPALFPQLPLQELVPLTRIMLLQPILLGFSNILAAITQSKQRYALYAVSPLLYNAGIIFGIVAFYPLWGLNGLAWGVVAGAALHVGIQIPSVVGDGFFARVPRFWEPKALLQTAMISVPRALALSMNQVATIGLTVIAATLASGSIAIFTFAYNLFSVPLGVIGASYSVAAFPTLSAALSAGKKDEFIEHIATAARHVLFWSLPATALVIVLRAHIVRVVLGSGQFDWTDTRLTAAALALLSLSLVAQGVLLLLIRGYYAAGRTFVPFFLSVGIAGGTVGLAELFVRIAQSTAVIVPAQSLLRVGDVPGSSVLALALAYTLASVAGAIVLIAHFEYRFRGFFGKVKRALWQSCVAGLFGGVAAYLTLALVGPLTLVSTLASVFVHGSAAGAAGLIVAACAYHLLKSCEYSETIEALHARLWRYVPRLRGISRIASAEEDREL